MPGTRPIAEAFAHLSPDQFGIAAGALLTATGFEEWLRRSGVWRKIGVVARREIKAIDADTDGDGVWRKFAHGTAHSYAKGGQVRWHKAKDRDLAHHRSGYKFDRDRNPDGTIRSEDFHVTTPVLRKQHWWNRSKELV